MNEHNEQLAHRYASAFLNLFMDQMSVDDVMRIKKAYEHLMSNSRPLFFLGFPMITVVKQQELIDIMFDYFSLFKPLKKLSNLLIKHRRGILFADVLKHIWWHYFQRKGIEYVTITSSHELSKDKIHVFQEYLARLSGKDILYEYGVDATLIAGIRMQSNQILWEHSIRNQLRALRQSCNV